jgi:hypothetical protein
MPTGVQRTSADELARLRAAIAELNERVERINAQEKGRAELVRWLAARPALTRKDVQEVARQMNRHGGFPAGVADAAVRQPGKGGHRVLMPAVGTVGKTVRAARLAAGMSTTELGNKMKVGGGYISMVERGKLKPGDQKRADFARALKLPAGALANGHAPD